jgi:hypothetical protein
VGNFLTLLDYSASFSEGVNKLTYKQTSISGMIRLLGEIPIKDKKQAVRSG